MHPPLSHTVWGSLLAIGLLLAACGPSAAVPVATRTPMPTFTPTPEIAQPTVDPNIVATAQAVATQAAQQAQAGQQNTPTSQEQQPPAEGGQAPQATQAITATATPTPTNTPAPQVAEVVVTSQINVRQGPGTNYNIIGAANQGERFNVTGKNQTGDWWQIDYRGQPGWVFGQLVTPQNTGAVQVAQNIPAPPPPPPPTNTPVPQPTQPPAPPPTPKSNYKFNVVVVSRCEPQEAGNWFEGTTYIGGQPQNGYKVVFSTSPDGGWVTQPQISGPHEGYPGWKTGYYSHIINAPQAGPKAGNWFAWIVDDQGNRISEIANWQFTGKGGSCNQVVVDWDSR